MTLVKPSQIGAAAMTNDTAQSRPPSLATLYQQGVHDLEFICPSATCDQSLIVPLDEQFDPNETVITIAKRARCSACGHRGAIVSPIWSHTRMIGGLPATYGRAKDPNQSDKS